MPDDSYKAASRSVFKDPAARRGPRLERSSAVGGLKASQKIGAPAEAPGEARLGPPGEAPGEARLGPPAEAPGEARLGPPAEAPGEALAYRDDRPDRSGDAMRLTPYPAERYGYSYAMRPE